MLGVFLAAVYDPDLTPLSAGNHQLTQAQRRVLL